MKYLLLLAGLFALFRLRHRLGPFLSQMVPPSYLLIGGLMTCFGIFQGWDEEITFEVAMVTGLGGLIFFWGIELWRKEK